MFKWIVLTFVVLLTIGNLAFGWAISWWLVFLPLIILIAGATLVAVFLGWFLILLLVVAANSTDAGSGKPSPAPKHWGSAP